MSEPAQVIIADPGWWLVSKETDVDRHVDMHFNAQAIPNQQDAMYFVFRFASEDEFRQFARYVERSVLDWGGGLKQKGRWKGPGGD